MREVATVTLTSINIVAILVSLSNVNGSERSVGKLKVGDSAPFFDLVGSDGRNHRIEDHVGKRAVVLAWFPKAFTGG